MGTKNRERRGVGRTPRFDEEVDGEGVGTT
jgi:hypothetical protein